MDKYKYAARVIARCQEILTAHIQPNGTTEKECIRQLLEVLDNAEIVRVLGNGAASQTQKCVECGNCFEGKSDMDHTCKDCNGTGVAKNKNCTFEQYQGLRLLNAVKTICAQSGTDVHEMVDWLDNDSGLLKLVMTAHKGILFSREDPNDTCRTEAEKKVDFETREKIGKALGLNPRIAGGKRVAFSWEYLLSLIEGCSPDKDLH